MRPKNLEIGLFASDRIPGPYKYMESRPASQRDPNRQQDGAAALAQERRIASNQTPVAPADNNKWHSEPGKSNDV